MVFLSKIVVEFKTVDDKNKSVELFVLNRSFTPNNSIMTLCKDTWAGGVRGLFESGMNIFTLGGL